MTAERIGQQADWQDAPLVSVVIPAYNASATLSETLASVLAPDLSRLEVVVVDDGSSDATADIVVAAAAHDSRVCLLRQTNAGVATARNRGIAETSGAFVAFVDADDVWAHDKIARQVAALDAAGDDTGLCYTWYVTIDAHGMVLAPRWQPQQHGAVLAALCACNFVGNGSSLACAQGGTGPCRWLRRELARARRTRLRGLRSAAAHCRNYKFALIEEALVGYRIVAGSMSIDRARMVLSWRMVAEQAARRRPDLASLLIKGRINYALSLMVGMLLRGRLIAGAQLARQTGLPPWRLAPPLAGAMAVRIGQAIAKMVRRAAAAPRRFGDVLASMRHDLRHPHHRRRRLCRGACVQAAGCCRIPAGRLRQSLDRPCQLRAMGPSGAGDIRNPTAVADALRSHRAVAVMHFAADAYVRQSIIDPARYYDNNVAGTLSLLAGMRAAGCAHLIFSSSCAIYGEPSAMPIAETTPPSPVNPYGTSKLMAERILADFQAAYEVRSIRLRYFNACGADAAGRIGEWRNPETHLIPRAMMALQGYIDDFQVFGADYDTPDGTAVRDYVYVADLADAHCAALDLLLRDGLTGAYNLGTGVGISVREVLDAVQSVAGRQLPAVVGSRQNGDPPCLVADPTLAKRVLGFSAARSDLRTIVETAWAGIRQPIRDSRGVR